MARTKYEKKDKKIVSDKKNDENDIGEKEISRNPKLKTSTKVNKSEKFVETLEKSKVKNKTEISKMSKKDKTNKVKTSRGMEVEPDDDIEIEENESENERFNSTIKDDIEMNNNSKVDIKDKLVSSDLYTSIDLSDEFYSKLGFKSDSLYTYCCVSCNNRNILRAVNNGNCDLLEKCFNAKSQISNINEIWSEENKISPIYLATMRGNFKILKKFSEFYKNKKLHIRVQKARIKLREIGTGGVSERTFGRAVRAVQMTRGGKQGNNAFIENFNVKKSWKLDFINGLIETNNKNLFQLLKLFNYKGADWQSYRHISRKKNIDENLFDQETNLYKAVSAGKIELANYILSNLIERSSYFNDLHKLILSTKDDSKINVTFKPSINKKGYYDISPIHFACINSNEKILKKLVEHEGGGGDLHAIDMNMKKAIHYAAVCNGLGPLKYLINEKRVSVDDPDKTKTTPLMYACKWGRYENVKFLLENGADLNRKNGTGGDNAFIIAAKNNRFEIVKYLIENKNIDVNTIGQNRMSALHYAAINGNEKLLAFLCVKGANINIKDKFGRTPLLLACKSGNIRIVNILLKLKAKINLPDTSNNTPLHYACAFGYLEIVSTLLDEGADINSMNSWKTTPLELTLLKNHYGVLKFILNNNKDINIDSKFDSGETLLLNFISNITNKSLEGVKYIVQEKNANLNITNTNKISALHLLCKFNFNSFLSNFYPVYFKATKNLSDDEYLIKKIYLKTKTNID